MENGQLTVRDIRGPYMQLLTNLQGENGQEWLDALKLFNSKLNPWVRGSTEVDCRSAFEGMFDVLDAQGKGQEALLALAKILQAGFQNRGRASHIYIGLEYAMRAVIVALEDVGDDEPRVEYVLSNFRQGGELIELWAPQEAARKRTTSP